MTPYETAPYTPEHAQAFKDAEDIKRMKQQPGWIILDEQMSRMVETAQSIALHTQTHDPAVAVDLLRMWQITLQVVDAIRATADQIIQNAKDLAPQNDQERDQLKEIYGGPDTVGDPIGD